MAEQPLEAPLAVGSSEIERPNVDGGGRSHDSGGKREQHAEHASSSHSGSQSSRSSESVESVHGVASHRVAASSTARPDEDTIRAHMEACWRSPEATAALTQLAGDLVDCYCRHKPPAW